MWRTRSGAAQSADRRRLGPGTKLDYAWHVAGARESGAPDAVAGHDQFRRSQPRSGAAISRGQQPHPARNVGHGRDLRRKSRNWHGRRQSHGQHSRRQGGLQYALRQPQRLARGGSQGEAHVACACSIQPVEILSSRRNPERRPRWSILCSLASSACRWPKTRDLP